MESHENGGLLANLRRVNAQQASRPAPGGGPSIAAHAEHVRWFLRLAVRLADPERDTINWDAPDVKWANSWGVSQVNKAAWTNLIETLEREAGAVEAGLNLEAIKGRQSSDDMTGCLTVLPHPRITSKQ